MEEVKAAKFYTVLPDEVTSHSIEHLALCARFVDSHKDIPEEFLTFLPLELMRLSAFSLKMASQ